MKQVLIRQGNAIVEDVPAPMVAPGTILVQVNHSCISIGTETSGMKATKPALWKRALQQPENVKKVLGMVAAQGFSRTRSQIKGILSAGQPTGYSAAGIVLEVGEGVNDIRPQERVACAGAQCAHHAEIIRVPRNLTVPIPDKLDFAEASTVTLGAIALQGVRRAQPTLGETFVVIGLGVLGQLTVQILKANGCRVIGTDLDEKRIHVALNLGMDAGVLTPEDSDIETVERLTYGMGADGVIITAATASNQVVSTAFHMCRKKGRVVLVGDVGLNLNRADLYQKELDFFISTSYGPGRYDNAYEEKGMDYPVGYVRWTENRNMAEYLRLLADGKVNVSSLITANYALDQAPRVYEALVDGTEKPLLVLISYPQPPGAEPLARTVANPLARVGESGRIRIVVAGAGIFAKSMHLPNLQSRADLYHIQAVVSGSGHNALATARQFGANYAGTDYQQVLNDPEVTAVLIATRHNLHASMVLQALNAGKHVLVEKPLALKRAELDAIKDFYSANSETQNSTPPVLMTGFNRRFSPYAAHIKEMVANRSNPMIINYRMNAGYIPLDHWAHSEEGGGRNLGEACHIYDLFTFFIDSKVVTMDALAIKPITGYYTHQDNFIATMAFEDGSVATLTYTALGNKQYPKEQAEIFVDGKVLVLNDYKRLTIMGDKGRDLESKVMQKGHKEELTAFARAIQQGGDWPIPLWQQVQASEISLTIQGKLTGTTL